MEWISVNKELPANIGQLCLVRTSEGPCGTLHCYENNLWYGYGAKFHTNGITHWMPLPPPPTE